MTAAIPVFAERGILAASVEEICERAGFTRGAFYSNFDSKDELYFALLRLERDRYYAATEIALAGLPATSSRVVAPPQTSVGGGGSSPVDLASLIRRAVSTVVGARPVDRETVLATAEMRLYALRQPQVRAEYRRFQDETLTIFSDLLTGAFAATGARLALPAEDAISLLAAVYEQSQMAMLLDDDESSKAPGENSLLARNLSALLLALVEPPAAAE